MTGYAAEEPHFTKFLNKNVELLTNSLKDPKLPLMELKVRTELTLFLLDNSLRYNCLEVVGELQTTRGGGTLNYDRRKP